ncbi:asparagine synthase (glutamine-hydrolyzing) [Candidatus Uhrbacteria bacterium RIFCSPLOWO2_01_FULL_47_24]|uniref:asparagine synthase (glutamine-hydrolyzing) n=1 Tax=Candidatus Uhrbacteria bacterium RIFCSPLOWO2_01_FULL_47_24 TaxID=1802401 RepID=A0A1F7USQ5_9BACT|nr:MAG: asparagine synthase (glutamine-hydrolyzing) [Candidatus Uhrbacteria bacterium RIFCSPHIGHO2_01_FULL_47_11]OGL68007.1 MAG: asparagine synthase (glutamine-hydrolyzing) [Candidatus Uhrbacteria bacterium RIFCSPHIGHO2_02_FULL_46_47]OGL75419.1 MAG: asparagine synthase (glutamine-hydrolyzing) [Candidatus Uhrbacteria bacterium RIFCSPHIGHO2_12_FULL_47_11]OGL81321.1 MAG: asparagine synthase (glutamine-hydrolyzing) [Candidatus Uhrbacteria bacterium RIFCSPLOWO2_01_FULL_47_24]OGL83935.1 MAG: asparagi
MCGIAGIMAREVDAMCLKRMAQALTHRGPDDEGIERMSVVAHTKMLGMVHRRLSIIDLSPAGHQPMKDPATGNWITFNGEIYNYRELKRELVQLGDKFISDSDTEVILKAYARYGIKCLEKLRGMFAFALWDTAQEKLVLAVDRFGIKPMYYFHNGTTLVFASEVRALIASGLVPKEIDLQAVDSFFVFGAVQAPLTMIKGVRALLPAHYMIYEAASGAIAPQIYWQPHMEESQFTSCKEALYDSVRHHLVSDVPVGLFLSGGIDSSAIAIAAHEVSGGKGLESFSVVFPEKQFSEEQYARLIAKQFCAAHHEISLSASDLQSMLPAALAAMDQPTIDGLNSYVVSHAVAQTGIKVVLSGQGGDEVFGGYPTFQKIPAMRRLARFFALLPSTLRNAIVTQLPTRHIRVSKLSQLIGSGGDILSLYMIARQLLPPIQRNELRFGPQLSDDGITPEVRELLRAQIKDSDIFSAISFLELRGYLGNMLLRDGDMMSMAHSLEVRVPLLDHRLVQYVWGVLLGEKMARGITKPLLVSAVMDKMPKEIYQRKKMGFTFPWEYWLRTVFRPDIEALLAEFPEDNPVGLNVQACRNLWEQFLAGKNRITSTRVWAFYVLMHWLKKNL